MRKKVLLLTVFLNCLAVAFTAGSVRAALSSQSISTIYWDTLSISADSGMALQYIWKGDVSEAEAWDAYSAYAYDYEEADGWGDTSATASLKTATGSAWTTEDTIGESVYADADAGSYAYAGRALEFYVSSGSGTLTFSVEYELEQDMETDTLGNYAEADAWVWLGLYNLDKCTDDYRLVALNNEIYDGDSLSESISGILFVSLSFDEGESGWLDAGVENYASTCSVPLPTTILLLGSGLFGLAGFGRRKSKK